MEQLAIVSRLSCVSGIAVAYARLRGQSLLLALLSALTSLAFPAMAGGDIYKWIDEQGRINISNVLPPGAGKTGNVEVVLKEAPAGSFQQTAVTPTEQALLARIESLERQLQSRQYAAQAPAVPPPTPYGAYAPPPPPPPPSSGYYGSAYSGGYAAYFPARSYYPVASSYVVYPARTYLPQPVIVVPHGGHARGGSGHRGRR
jgi:hypothetical protein